MKNREREREGGERERERQSERERERERGFYVNHLLQGPLLCEAKARSPRIVALIIKNQVIIPPSILL